MADRQDWLLLLLALRDASRALDPVRMQKGMFLLAQERNIPAHQRYNFEPYDYGPFSSQIYSDLEDLVLRGLVDEIPAPGYTWSQYKASEIGIDTARQILEDLPSGLVDDVQWLEALKRDVLSLDFRSLLHHVYESHPEFATKSVFRG
jgi:uncharacterized protein YwgA